MSTTVVSEMHNSVIRLHAGRTATLATAALLWLMGGCATPEPRPEFTHLDANQETEKPATRTIAEDPERFLRSALERCAALDSYAVDFYKQERLGLLRQLQPVEHIRAKFRATPFSVKMDMLDEDNDFVETVYVEGRNDGKLRCRWRKSLWPGGKPAINDYDPAFAVAFGRSINPITDFGVARLMQRVITKLDEAIAMNLPPVIEYLGTTAMEIGDTPVHHIRLTYSAETGFGVRKVDLLFHRDTLLPAASYTWLANEQLRGKYIYTDFDLDVRFTDQDFRLSEDAADADAGESGTAGLK